MAGGVGIGADQGDAPAGEPGVGGPDLLAADQPAVVDRHTPRRQRSQVRTGVGLAEELAPELAGVEDRQQPAGLLLVGPVGQQGRARQVDPHPVDRLGRPGPGVLHVEQGHLDRRGVPAAVGRGPLDPHPAIGGQLRLPRPPPGDLLIGVGEVGRRLQMVGQPRPHLGGERLLGIGEGEVHRLRGPRSVGGRRW